MPASLPGENIRKEEMLYISVVLMVLSDLSWRADYMLTSEMLLILAAFCLIYEGFHIIHDKIRLMDRLEDSLDRWLENRKKRRRDNYK